MHHLRPRLKRITRQNICPRIGKTRNQVIGCTHARTHERSWFVDVIFRDVRRAVKDGFKMRAVKDGFKMRAVKDGLRAVLQNPSLKRP